MTPCGLQDVSELCLIFLLHSSPHPLSAEDGLAGKDAPPANRRLMVQISEKTSKGRPFERGCVCVCQNQTNQN